MLALIGRARVQAGLLPLARSVELDRTAAAQGQEMAAVGYMDHISVDGAGPQTRAGRFGYQVPAGTAWLVVETMSSISDAPEGALNWWLGDALHRGVLLRNTWREIGIAYVQGGPWGRFWVAEFGCRPNVLPPTLLDGMLSVPDELCGRGGSGVMGSVQTMRTATSPQALEAADWVPYAARQPWEQNVPAYVQVRDARGNTSDQLSVISSQ